MNAVNALIHEKGIIVQLQTKGIEQELLADEDKMQQVILNLLSNAIKFTRTEIKLRQEYTQTHWVLEVADNGLGIESGLKEMVFEKFYQARNQTLRKPKGSGLGLAISRRIAELHQGTLELFDEEGGGALFVLKVPLKPLILPNDE